MWGRGGAGNIQQAAEASKQRAPETQDLEAAAAKSPTPEDDTPTATTTSPTTSSAQQEYAHMGRGGAGNYYSPATLSSTGHFTTDTTSPTATTAAAQQATAEPPPTPLANLDTNTSWFNTASVTPPIYNPNSSSPSSNGDKGGTAAAAETLSPVARTGRGGAGNYVWGTPDVSQRRAEQIRREWEDCREREKGVKAKVAQDVDRGLPKPPSAFLASERPARD